MILQRLYKFAEDHNLVEDPDFEEVGIHWLINVGNNGEFLGLLPLGDVLENKKSKGKLLPVPKRFVRSSGVAPYFLADKPQYIFPSWTDEKKRKTFPKTYHEKFTELIRSSFDATQDEEIKAVLNLLSNESELNKALTALEEHKIDFSNHEITFSYETAQNLLLNNTSARNFWRQIRSSKSDSQDEVLCLITGIEGSSVINHDPLKGVPGATTSGAPLISFNTDAFESYGLEGNENAPISKLASEQSMAALKKLLSDKKKIVRTIKKGKTEKQEEKEIFTNRINISNDTCAVYWLRSKNEEFDCYLNLMENGSNATDEQATKLFDSIFEGKSPSRLNPNEFYLLVLKGNQGRIAISSYLEESLSVIQENIINWFKDLDLNEDPERKVSKSRKELLRSLIKWAKASDDEKISPRLSLELFLAVIRGSPLPRSILTMALERLEQEPNPGWGLLSKRVSLLKAYLLKVNRDLYADFFNKDKQMNLKTLDKEKKDSYIAYQLGKLFWILTDTQRLAIVGTPQKKQELQDQDKDTKDKEIKSSSSNQHHGSSTYFKLASSRPSKIFHHLLTEHRTVYLPKLKRDRIGIARRKDEQISEILDEFSSHFELGLDNPFPESLTQENRALFILGFYKQQQKDKKDKDDAIQAAKKKNTEQKETK